MAGKWFDKSKRIVSDKNINYKTSIHHASEGFAKIVELLERYDNFRHAPMGNQKEASTTAVTAGSAERPFENVFALMRYTIPMIL